LHRYNESAKKHQVEAAKATEASKLMDKWRLKAEEAGKKISQLELAVKDAAEAKEAKAAVAKVGLYTLNPADP
jgi:alpha-D-ribose 1-methylphosphonate 5-triphosphate synthase subunit PhnG